jgi:hypothetical protein
LTPTLTPTTSLDGAWQLVEGALPEGWRIIRLRWRRQGHWTALALDVSVAPREHDGRSARTGIGPTPASALVDLAAQFEGAVA